MDKINFSQSIWFMVISGIGGFLLSLTGLGIGWMIGTIILAAIFSLRQPVWLKITNSKKGLPPYWIKIGQLILAIEMGQQLNSSIIHTFAENWMTVLIMLLLSILFSILSGIILWKFTGTDLLTSLFATAPGGVATLPGIAEDVGANTAIVSIIQTIRIFIVVLTIPIIASSWLASPADTTIIANSVSVTNEFEISQLLGTFILVLTAWGGVYVGKLLRLPAPWLVGGLLCVAVLQTVYSGITGHNLAAWWPPIMMIFAQIFIASSIGSRFQRSMFIGIRKTVVVALISTIGLVIAMFGCAFIVSKLTGISLLTSALAFAPGGVAEMSATALVLNADSTFVVAVQVLRIVCVILILPPLFRLFYNQKVKKQEKTQASV